MKLKFYLKKRKKENIKMCRFKSGIQLKNRNVLTSIYNDSHSDLLKDLKIEDSRYNAETKFVRAELIPPNNNITADISEWKYNVDQDIVPDWFDLDREKYEQSFREDVKDWLNKNLTVEYVCGKPWTTVKDGDCTYHFMYGSLFKSRFGNTNNYAESEARKKLVNSDLAKELEDFYGDKLLPITLDLTALNGSKEYGVVAGDKIAVPTLDILRKFKENIPLVDDWYWTSTPNRTKITGDSSYVRNVDSDGGVGYGDCDWSDGGVRPFYITKS